MQQVVLGTTGRTTSRLGYGCSSILGGLSRRESLRMLEAAYDAGIRHYDVAPLYGFGEAEACLGDFLSRRTDCTVTTKYGLEAGRPSVLKQALRSVARPVLKAVPGLKKKLVSPAPAQGTPAHRAPLSAAAAKKSLEQSLRNLRTGRVDVFLLHEAELADTEDAALLRVLEDAQQRGDIGTYGVGSERAKVEEICAIRPEFCPVVQHGWSVLDAGAPACASFRIHHRALLAQLDRLASWLAANDTVARQWSDELGTDLSDRKILANLMLKSALVVNPESILLVSTKRPSRVASNAAIAENAALEAPAKRLYELVQTVRKEVIAP